MPEFDGWDVCARIRAYEQENPGQKRLPIVALTAMSFAEDRANALEAGFDDWISKPFERKVLLDKIIVHSE